MNEVEKMYSLAGVEPINFAYYGSTYVPDSMVIDGKFYPPFTAEKQLELVKWLGKNKDGFGLFNDGTEGLSCHCDFNWEWFEKDFYAEDFNNALAGLINNLWQDLTKEERKQIKNILELEVRE